MHVFQFDPNRTDPETIARRDYESTFVVERIIRHSGDTKLRKSLDFLVRWEGYDEAEDLWLPYRELRDNPALHRYLDDSNDRTLRNLIPIRHRK